MSVGRIFKLDIVSSLTCYPLTLPNVNTKFAIPETLAKHFLLKKESAFATLLFLKRESTSQNITFHL